MSKTIFEVVIDLGDGYYTCGFTDNRVEADFALNAYKRWWDRIWALSGEENDDEEQENLDKQRELLIKTICNLLALEHSSALEEHISEMLNEGYWPDFEIREHKIGIDWGLKELSSTMPPLETA